jgi:AcrR family transcriptional regulator
VAVATVRAYRQRARADAAAARRQTVLDATIAMLGTEALPRVTLDAVAQRAGVARSTLYVQFGARTGLFEAVAERLLVRIEFDRLATAVRLVDPRQALRAALAESVRLYAAERDVSRALWSWADLDPDAGRAIAVLDGGRAEGTRHLVRRLAHAGALRPDSSVAEASDALYVLTSFDAFDTLYTQRGLAVADVTDRLTAMVERLMLA